MNAMLSLPLISLPNFLSTLLVVLSLNLAANSLRQEVLRIHSNEAATRE